MDTTSTITEPLLLDRPEAAARLGVNDLWLKREITAGRVQTTKVGRRYKFSPADLQAFIDARTVKPLNRPA